MGQKKLGPYVGVTGFTDRFQIVTCSNTFYRAAQEQGQYVAQNLKFMAGELVSSKTLAGGINKYPNRYPQAHKTADIFDINDNHVLRTIHYNTDDASTIDDQVEELMKLAPGLIDALQLNIRWVSPVKLQRIRRRHPNLRIILQIGSGALTDVAEPGEIFLGEALKAYEGVADDFLIDPSGGEGKELNLWHALACIVDDDIPAGMQPNIAGGFYAGKVPRARGLMRRLKRPVGLDAEKQLRDENDFLIMPKTTDYIQVGAALVGEFILRYRKN